MNKNLLTIIFLLCTSISFAQDKMTLKGEMSDYTGEQFLLLTGDNGGVFIVDSATVNSDGIVEFTWEGSPGFYRMVNKGESIDIRIHKRSFSFALAGDIKNGDLQFVDNDENYEYQYYLSEFSILNESILTLRDELIALSEKDSLYKEKYSEFKKLKKAKRNLLKDLWGGHIDSWSARFALAQQELIPDIKLKGKKADEYYLKHFFDYFAFSDSLLSGTPVYYEKFAKYLKAHKLDKLIENQNYGKIKEVIGNLFWLTELDPGSQKYMANYLMNRFPEEDYSEVYHIVSDAYRVLNTCEYMLNSKTIKRRINNFKSIKKGWQVPDIPLYHTQDERIQNLTNVNSELTLLIVWSGSCEHSIDMLSQITELYYLYKEMGLEVVAVSLDSNLNYWKSTVLMGDYPWINSCDTEGLQGSVANQLNIFVTPSLFLIDSSLKTIALPQTFFQLEKKLAEIFR
ncbi:thioredoxin-like domain-containing protein [Marinifilum sp.]|uniref:thioredoxin-like domain-containing protein n=1 Tax=Marinifilum sp. TaxID=2033137 RepID=UPI003BAAAC3B